MLSAQEKARKEEEADIDFQMRYSEREQPEVAAFLGYEEEK